MYLNKAARKAGQPRRKKMSHGFLPATAATVDEEIVEEGGAVRITRIVCAGGSEGWGHHIVEATYHHRMDGGLVPRTREIGEAFEACPPGCPHR